MTGLMTSIFGRVARKRKGGNQRVGRDAPGAKENSAVQDTHTGILQPYWSRLKNFKIVKLNWLDRLLKR